MSCSKGGKRNIGRKGEILISWQRSTGGEWLTIQRSCVVEYRAVEVLEHNIRPASERKVLYQERPRLRTALEQLP